jgi:hypothetical protein
MPAETDQTTAKELSDRWWEASEDYRKNWHWLRAAASLVGGDKRLLLLGPGKENTLHEITLGLKEFLIRAGFDAAILDGDLDLSEHRRQAAGYPRIVALPITIGSCVEVLDFSKEPDLRRLLSVVLPGEHRGGYFARVVEDQGLKIRECGQVGDEVDDSLGKKCLIALAGPLGREESASEATAWTRDAPPEENAQAREAKGEIEAGSGGTVESPPMSGLTKGIFAFGALAVVAFVVLTLLASIFAGLVLVGILIAVLAFALRSEGKLSETHLVEVILAVLKQVPKLKALGRRQDQKQLPPGGSSDPPDEEDSDPPDE